MGLYTNLAKVANRLIKSKGQTVFLLKKESKPFNRNTQKARTTEVRYKSKGVFFPITSENAFGTLIEAGHIRMILSAFDIDGNALRRPNEGDRIRDAAQNYYNIKEALPLNPDGTIVFYDCLLKGAGSE